MKNKEHIERLREDFPEVLGKARISVGSGWEDIVRGLAKDLSGTGAQAAVVKEKFGGMRFQIGPPLIGGDGNWSEPDDPGVVRQRIREAEARSKEVCERCGSEENVTTQANRFWVKTFCDRCRVEDWEEQVERYGSVSDEPPEAITEAKERLNQE